MDTGRKTFAFQLIGNQSPGGICEDMAQMRRKLGLVLKPVSGGAEKINVMNYLTRTATPAKVCYYEEDPYEINETKVRTMVITTERVNMYEMGHTITTTTKTRPTMTTD